MPVLPKWLFIGFFNTVSIFTDRIKSQIEWSKVLSNLHTTNNEEKPRLLKIKTKKKTFDLSLFHNSLTIFIIELELSLFNFRFSRLASILLQSNRKFKQK